MHGSFFVCLVSIHFSLSVSLATDSFALFRNGKTRTRLSPSARTVTYASQRRLQHASETSVNPNEQPHVELLRFVTAYRTGIEALVDMTSYSPLIQAAAATNNLTMYTFIDTWVTNNTERDILYLNNATGRCFPKKVSQGNGWSLSASLLFWPLEPSERARKSSQPRETITLSSGWYGGGYSIGRVGTHAASISGDGRALLLDEAIDLSTAKIAAVYSMQQKDVAIASLMGFVAQQTERYTRSGNSAGLDAMTQDAFETLLWPGLAALNVSSTDNKSNLVHAKYNGSKLLLEEDMPVYYASGDVFSDQKVSKKRWLNVTMPLKPVGKILYANGHDVTLQLQHQCMPSKLTKHLPHLLVPWSPNVVPKIQSMIESAKRAGIASATGAKATDEPLLLKDSSLGSALVDLDSDESKRRPAQERVLLLEPNKTDLVSPLRLAEVDLTAVQNANPRANMLKRLPLKKPVWPVSKIIENSKVLLLTQERHGLLLQKKFDLKNLQAGDKVVLQLAVTGHGWASTAEQCGEYCHAVYHMQLNGRSAANVTEFRDDCKNNPIDGRVQSGTWEESRNGWCPGTVVPGLFIDVTDHVRRGPNSLKIDLMVWSNETQKYEPYTDYAGFVFNDIASLAVGMTAFVYDKTAVERIRKQSRALSAAEAAVRNGCNQPERLKPPAIVRDPDEGSVLLQMSARTVTRSQDNAGLPVDKDSLPREPPALMRRQVSEARGHAANVAISPHKQVEIVSSTGESAPQKQAAAAPFDFERRSPWYLYNEKNEGHIKATRVPLFENELMQANSRDVQVHLNQASIPTEWSQVAVHFQLKKPDGKLEIDHWDRVGSLGFRFGGH